MTDEPSDFGDELLVNIFGRIIAVPRASHEELCEELRQYHAKLPGPPEPGQVDGHGKAKAKRKTKGKAKKAKNPTGELFG